MFTLITQSLEDKSLDYLIKFPTDFMTDSELEYLGWIFKYRSKYGSIPTLKRFVAEFPKFTPIPTDNPIGDTYESELEEKKRIFVVAKANEILLDAEQGKEVGLEKVNELARTLNKNSGEIYSYKDFDRKEYTKKRKRLKFGIPLMDRVTGGLISGDFVLIAGKLGSYKTTLLQWITLNWVKEGKRVLFVSNELLPSQITNKFDGMAAKFNPLELRKREITKSELEEIERTVKGYEGDFYIPTKRLMTPSEVFASAEYLAVDAVVIDGVHLMKVDRRQKQGELWQQLTRVSNDLKQYALSTNLPILGVTQLNRSAGKGGSEFSVDDVGGSYALSQDCDIMLGIKKDETIPNAFEVSSLKNRFGSDSFSVMVKIEWETMTVKDLTV